MEIGDAKTHGERNVSWGSTGRPATMRWQDCPFAGVVQVGEQDPRVPLKLQIEMEWFEKHVYTRAYCGSRCP